jgi:hypothetical protein
MPNRLKPLNLVDFTGGINLRPETFQLAENELPELLNLEVDPRGGLNCRKGWKTLAVNPVTTTKTWNGRNAYLHVKADGTRIMLVCNRDPADVAGGEVYAKVTPAVTWSAIIAPSCTAVPHGADFAAWDDDAWIVRGAAATVTYNGTAVTTLTASGAANWQNDYTNPGATNTAPAASLIAQHQGYMFTAVTREDGVTYPNRIRWSHPNNPRRWAQTDYIDISEGGQGITGIIPFSDRLVIFKPDAVWALFGYNADTWAVTNISRTIGALNQQVIARSENSVFFLSWPHGVFAYDEKANVNEISTTIRRVFEDQAINPVAMANSWMGWVGRRLWVSLPYYLPNKVGLTHPADAVTAFVFDPVTSSWTSFQGAGANVPGPYLERVESLDDEVQVAFMRTSKYSVRLDGRDDAALDEFVPGTTAAFPTAVRTKWLDAGTDMEEELATARPVAQRTDNRVDRQRPGLPQLRQLQRTALVRRRLQPRPPPGDLHPGR